MELSVLFGVFDDIFKRPECDMNSHVHLKKKNGFSHDVICGTDAHLEQETVALAIYLLF